MLTCADRAYRCGVCRELYSAPPRLLQGRLNIAGSLTALALTSLVVLLALGGSGARRPFSGAPCGANLTPQPPTAPALFIAVGQHEGGSVLCTAQTWRMLAAPGGDVP